MNNADVDFAKKNCKNYTREFMKKLLGILVLGFLFSGNANVGVIEPGTRQIIT